MDDVKSLFLISLEERIRHGSRCPECHPLQFNATAEGIHRMLFALKGDPRAMTRLRGLLLRFRERVWQFDDHEVVRQVAGLLASRRLHICGQEERRSPMSGGQAEPEAPPMEPPPPSQPVVRSRPSPEPPTFDDDHLPGAQAGALQSAAELGVPFCEVCQREGRG